MIPEDLNLGEKLKFFRSRAKLTQSRLAKKVGVHRTTISRWEQNDHKRGIPDSYLMRIAKATHISINQLYPNEDNQLNQK